MCAAEIYPWKHPFTKLYTHTHTRKNKQTHARCFPLFTFSHPPNLISRTHTSSLVVPLSALHEVYPNQRTHSTSLSRSTWQKQTGWKCRHLHLAIFFFSFSLLDGCNFSKFDTKPSSWLQVQKWATIKCITFRSRFGGGGVVLFVYFSDEKPSCRTLYVMPIDFFVWIISLDLDQRPSPWNGVTFPQTGRVTYCNCWYYFLRFYLQINLLYMYILCICQFCWFWFAHPRQSSCFSPFMPWQVFSLCQIVSFLGAAGYNTITVL